MASATNNKDAIILGPFITTWNGQANISSSAFLSAFAKYDKDNNGYIEGNEIDFFLADLVKDQNLTQSDIKAFQLFKNELFLHYDRNKDKRIELTELSRILPTEENFLLQFRLKCNDLTSIDFMKIWKHYDSDCNGYLDKTEIQGLCYDLLSKKKNRRVNMTAVKEFSDGVIELYDKNKDGKLNIRELQKLLPVEKNYLSRIFQKQKTLSEEDFNLIFMHYDQDNDGSISESELEAFIRDLMLHKGKAEQTNLIETMQKNIMKHVDKNKDGKIQRKELSILFTNKKAMNAWQ